MTQGNVEVASRDGTGIKVNNEWYNVPAGIQPPRRGDFVTFEPQPDPSGRGVLAANLQVQPGQQGGYGGGGGYNRGGGGGRGRPGGGGGRPQRTPRDIYGPIVGHNLLIAATILGPGTDVQTLVGTARQIMTASDALLQEVIAGQGQVQQGQQPAQQQGIGYTPQNPQNQQFGYQQPQPRNAGPYQQPAQQPQNNVADQGFDDDIPWG